MITLYSMPSSGNSYKVRLLLALLGRPYTHVPCEDSSPAWQSHRAKAPTGKLPFVVLPDGRALAESNAILWYLAEGTALIPDDPVARAQVLGWMFFEQNRHEPVIAVRSALRSYPQRAHLATPDRMADLLSSGTQILQILEDHLTTYPWFGAPDLSVADIALYGYTHSAQSLGGFDLSPLPALRDWIARIAEQPGYVSLADGADG